MPHSQGKARRHCFGGIVFGRPGSDLLSQVLRHSTIGAEEFDGRVRDGIGYKLLAKATRPTKNDASKQSGISDQKFHQSKCDVHLMFIKSSRNGHE